MGQGASCAAAVSVVGAGDWTEELPDECLAAIFGKLGCHDRNACSLVSRRWREVDAGCRHRLALGARADVTPTLPSLLRRFAGVTTLALKCSRKAASVDDAALAHIGRGLPALSRLKIKGCVNFSDDGLVAFSQLRPSLVKLSLASSSFSAPGLNAILANCRRLVELSLKRLRKLDGQSTPLFLAGAGEERFDKVAALERLCIKDLHNARLFASLLRSARRLRALVVYRSSGPWDQVLEELPTSLVELHVESAHLSDAGLAAVARRCRDLEVLNVGRVSDCSDAGFAAIGSSCRRLRKLHIDAGGKFGSGRSVVGDAGVSAMAAKCPNLQEVVLMGVPLTVLALDALAGNCPSLERMALCNTESVGDSELGFVAAKFTPLKKLCIKNCPVSDPGVVALSAGCPNLVKLKVKRCRGVTPASVGRLRSERRSLVLSMDADAFSFEEEDNVGEEEDIQATVRHSRPQRRIAPAAHVVCGSRGAGIIKSKLLRRPAMASSSSSCTHRRCY